MGAADVIPGVSGGTIAFITGIYERWIDALKRLDMQALRFFLTGKWQRLWHHVDGGFLAPLLGGMLVAILSLAKLIKFLMVSYPVPLWAFFWGLIVASAWVVRLRIRRWKIGVLVLFMVGIVGAGWISSMAPTQRPGTPLELLGSGALAISAMMLPGISGSYILMVLGKYEQAIHSVAAVVDFFRALVTGRPAQWPGDALLALAMLLVGIIIGFIVFSRLLSWLLHHYHDRTLAALMGFMVGSLYKVWPWKKMVDGYVLGYIPGTADPHFWSGVAWIIIGMACVVLLERWAPPYRETP